jgi:hypothetical protein
VGTFEKETPGNLFFFFFGKQIPPLSLSMQPYLPSGVLSARYSAQSNRVDFEVVHSQ